MNSGPIGRDGEIAEIHGFFSASSGAPAALVIAGDAGIGKTVVWKHVVQAAAQSSRVLSCRPTWAERPFAFSALDDLFYDVAADVLPALPGPRKRAVEAALLRDATAEPWSPVPSEADHPCLDQRVLARGMLDVLRTVSASGPLVLAVDDAQWLDPPSARVLQFCFRRLQDEPVLVVLTIRGNRAAFPLGLASTLLPDRLRWMRLGPLSLGAIGEILRSQLGDVFPRYTLTRLYEACGGNPFYALESARALAGRPRIPVTNEPIPIPQSLSHLVRRRVQRLTPEVRRVGWLIAASSAPRERVIRAACGDGESWVAIDHAISEGIIERDDLMLQFTHPLLRSMLYGEMSPHERREIHQRLGRAEEGIEERAWHLALGADRPSEQIAQMLDIAARHAASRGAPEAAAMLEEQATRLSPADRSGSARERTIGAADYHFRAGNMARSRELIESTLSGCPAGPLRASLLLRMATVHYHQSGWPLAEQTLRQAAQEVPEDPALRAQAEQELAFARLVAGDLPDACHWASASLRSAQRTTDPHLIAHSLARTAVFEFLRGRGAQLDLLDGAEKLNASASAEPVGRLPLFGPSLAKGIVLKWCDRLDDARLQMARQYQHAFDGGNEASLPFLLYHFSELECWAGNWDVAEEYALEGCRVAEDSHQQAMAPATLYSLALVRAHRGQVAPARELAGRALALCEQTGNVPVSSLVLSVFGFLALSLDDHRAAHSHLGGIADAITGLGQPSVVKFLPDEIEALAALGELDLARSFTRELEEQGVLLGRPWARATGARCRAHLAAIDGDLEGALVACKHALSQHEHLPMPFEFGRTLLVTGTIERRAKHKAAAREALGRALTIFEHLDAPLWTAKARRELSKITRTTPVAGLTGTERRVAALIAQGQTNREVASAMFVTENTVQTHLRHIFQKLGVRSRTELAARLLSASANTAIGARPAVGSDPR